MKCGIILLRLHVTQKALQLSFFSYFFSFSLSSLVLDGLPNIFWRETFWLKVWSKYTLNGNFSIWIILISSWKIWQTFVFGHLPSSLPKQLETSTKESYLYSLEIFNPSFDRKDFPVPDMRSFLLEWYQYYLEHVEELSLLIFSSFFFKKYWNHQEKRFFL